MTHPDADDLDAPQAFCRGPQRPPKRRPVPAFGAVRRGASAVTKLVQQQLKGRGLVDARGAEAEVRAPTGARAAVVAGPRAASDHERRRHVMGRNDEPRRHLARFLAQQAPVRAHEVGQIRAPDGEARTLVGGLRRSGRLAANGRLGGLHLGRLFARRPSALKSCADALHEPPRLLAAREAVAPGVVAAWPTGRQLASGAERARPSLHRRRHFPLRSLRACAFAFLAAAASILIPIHAIETIGTR